MKSNPFALAALPVLPAALAAFSSHAPAQIIPTDLGPAGITVSAGSTLYFDLDHSGGGPVHAGISTVPFGGADFRLFFEVGFVEISEEPGYIIGPTSTLPRVSGMGSNSILSPSAYLSKLSVGIPIFSSVPENFVNIASINHYGLGSWTAGTRGLLGLSLTSDGSANFGWADIAYNSDQSLTLYGFAYETSGGAIAAGDTIGAAAVPEPPAYAAMAGLLAGSAALYRRRQQKKLAAPRTE